MSTTPSVLQFPVELKDLVCPSCGTKFALPKVMHDQLRETHSRFFCPNGHTLSFLETSNTDRIKELEEILEEKEEALRRISRIETGVFNKASLELAIEIATSALDSDEEES